jgi:hypothetical protein
MSESLNYRIVVYSVSGGEIANIIRGYIIKGEERIKFTGVAYGRFGGQNVVPRLSPSAKKRIKELFGSISEFEYDLQQRLVKGDFEIMEER